MPRSLASGLAYGGAAVQVMLALHADMSIRCSILSRDRIFGPHQQAGVGRDSKLYPEVKAAIASSRFVVAFGIGKGVLFPGQQCKPRADSIQQNSAGLSPWQVEIAIEVLHELADWNVVPAP
ncbi:MAG TPA: hypothetical protein VGP28_03875 [Methylocella sp.]|jgi:hypothetical protein|nr:hypothetical protein [Methylocella sp.]